MATTIYFVTNRRPNSERRLLNFTGEFAGSSTANLRYGAAKVSGRKIELKLYEEILRFDEERGRLADNSKLGSVQAMTLLRRQMKASKRDVLVFVHGYNVKFKDAVRAVARLTQQLEAEGKPVIPVLFSWPSDGSKMPWLAYGSDRHDARASGPAFGRAFLKLAKFLSDASLEEECSQGVHLMAHSMGNYVLRHALQAIRGETAGRLPRVFDQVLLMAADEDDDAFEHDHKLAQLPQIARGITVYFNKLDLALHISDKTKANPDRLGTDGPRTPGVLPSRVSQVDCSEVADGAVKHSYYVDAAEVVRDAAGVLKGAPADALGRPYIQEKRQYRLAAAGRGSG